MFHQAGTLSFASREEGFEAASEATLRSEGIPVERLLPEEVAVRWPHIAVDGIAFATFEPEAGLLLARRGVATVVRELGREGGRFELGAVRPGRTAGGRLTEVVAWTAAATVAICSFSRAGRGCPGSSRRSWAR